MCGGMGVGKASESPIGRRLAVTNWSAALETRSSSRHATTVAVLLLLLLQCCNAAAMLAEVRTEKAGSGCQSVLAQRWRRADRAEAGGLRLEA